MLPGIILCLLRVELALNDGQQSGKCKLVTQTAAVCEAENCFRRHTAQCHCACSHSAGEVSTLSWKHLPDPTATAHNESSKLEADWSYWFSTVLLKPDGIQISFHFVWLKKPYRHLLKVVEVINSPSVQCHHSTQEKVESSQILVTGKHNVTYIKYLFFFNLLILES